MTPTRFEIVASVLFGLAILHTFCVSFFKKTADRFREGSVLENLFHLLSEIEVVFGLWAGVLVFYLSVFEGGKQAINLVEERSFTEPLFVFVIMVIAGTRPCLLFVERLLTGLSKLLPLAEPLAFFLVVMTVGPLLGSIFTEPAAMTVTAILIRDRYFSRDVPESFKYAVLGTLFVNVSIGGVLTHYAAPPVVMVASQWGWGTDFLLRNFGGKAFLAVVVNTLLLVLLQRRTFVNLKPHEANGSSAKLAPPWWLTALHLLFIGATIAASHHPAFFVGLFLFFLGMTTITAEYQDELKLREGLLVGFFLGGLVVLGAPQQWWLEKILPHLQPTGMFLSAIGLTAVFDNAALTYLGAQVPNLSDALKYALVAGAVTGGGLTVIANAPNPVGFGILRPRFSNQAINPVGLFVHALLPTGIAALCFWLLP